MLVFYFISAIGVLSLLAYSLLVFSDGLQQLGGTWAHRLIGKPTDNRLSYIGRGLAMTAIFQNPTAAVQTIAGLLNAGLLDLRSAFLMVMGANIGTISVLSTLVLLGWAVTKSYYFAAILMFIGYLMFKLGRRQLIVGLGRSFIGLCLIAAVFLLAELVFSQWQVVLGQIDSALVLNLASYALGFLMVVTFRSSVIVYGPAFFVFGKIGVLPAFHFLMGSLLARSISLLINTSNGNIYAKRVARLHLVFGALANIIFIIFVLLDFQNISWFKIYNASYGALSPLSLYVLVLLITPILLFLAQNSVIELVMKLVPEPEMRDEKQLEVLGDPRDMLPMTALVLGQRQIGKLQDIVNRMFSLTREYINSSDNQPRMMAKLKDYERITDNVKKEIMEFIHHLGQKPLSKEQSNHAQSLMKIADELESVADYLDKIAIFCTRLREREQWIESDREEFNQLFEKIYDFFMQTSKHIDPTKGLGGVDIDHLGDQAFSLKKMVEKARETQVEQMGSRGSSPSAMLAYSDMLVALRKVRSHTRNIGEAIP